MSAIMSWPCTAAGSITLIAAILYPGNAFAHGFGTPSEMIGIGILLLALIFALSFLGGLVVFSFSPWKTGNSKDFWKQFFLISAVSILPFESDIRLEVASLKSILNEYVLIFVPLLISLCITNKLCKNAGGAVYAFWFAAIFVVEFSVIRVFLILY